MTPLQSPLDPAGRDDAFALSGLDALLATAARSSPDTILVTDDDGGVNAATLARRTRVLAARLRLAGLRPGERLLIVAGAQVQTLVAIVAALRGGLEPALVRPGLGAVELAAHARACEAAALVGPAAYGEPLGETYLSAAALTDGIRLIAAHGSAAHGSEPVDGALDISAAALDAAAELPGDEPQLEAPLIATFAGPAAAPRLVSHRQAALFADALSLVEQAQVNPSRRILSLLPPSSRAGLVAGPFAALVGASELVLHGPFEARAFLRRLDAAPGSHLVAPAALGPLLTGATFAGETASLILVSRFADSDAFVLPEALPAAARPVADLYAYGEDVVLAQRRIDGEARPPARVADRSLTDGLGAKLNRARAEHRLTAGD